MMKRILAVLAAMTMLFASAALAENLSSLTDEELMELYREVQAEMVNRWINEQEEKAADAAEPEEKSAVTTEPDSTVIEGTDLTADEMDAATRRVGEFFTAWNDNDYDEMANLCSSEWKSHQENVKQALFTIIQNRKPAGFTLESMTGHPAGRKLYVTMNVTMVYFGNKEPSKLRMDVELIREDDGEWYVNPESLISFRKIMDE